MFLFLGIILICAIEYIGLGLYIPGAQRIPLFLSVIIFLAVCFSKDGLKVLKNVQSKALIIFIIHTGLSVTYAIVRTYAYNRLIGLLGYFILFISIYAVIKNAKQIRIFLASFLIYHCFLIAINFNKLNETVRLGSFKAGYFLGNGNDFAWSLTIFLPFAIYFLNNNRNKIIRCLLLAVISLFAIGVVGTGSRGAFLAVIFSGAYMLVNSPQKKTLAIILCALSIVLVAVFSPTSYIDRIESIGSYQDDNSALTRIIAWKAAMRMAIGHPFGVGAGNFNSAYGRLYRPSEADQVLSWATHAWISPHSIYFLTLGEYGLLGLITILSVLFFNFRDNHLQVKLMKNKSVAADNEIKLLNLPKYLNMSLIAFSVGGVFLGGLNYPHLFILTALILRTWQINAAGTKLTKKPHPVF